MNRLSIILIALAMALPAAAQRTPTMGWSSWNTFALNINEDLIRQQADAMHNSGLQEAGYRYINIDDGYWLGRGDDGVWQNVCVDKAGRRTARNGPRSCGSVGKCVPLPVKI